MKKNKKDLFFGREKDIEKLSELIKYEPLLLLYSKSGLGKSSLLNAGIQPKLEQQKNTYVVNIRFTRYTKGSLSPVDTIISKLGFNNRDRSLLDRIIAGDNSLWYHFKKDYLQMIEPQKYILIFDQFEELFSYPKEHIWQLKKQLADLMYVQVPQHYRDELNELLDLDPEFLDDGELERLHKPLDISVVTAIRSDKMSMMNELTDYLPTILKNFYELQPLNRDRAKDAIINPAQAIGEYLSDPFEYEPKTFRQNS
ncbi:MAG: ATP-binding protein [Chloroflexia bacterium]|nr:ATP-binding protein [Chloroflexia bacterium]